MADLTIKSYESFFSFLDKDETVSARTLSVSASRSFAQIFKAQAPEIESIFFLADEITTTIATTFTVEVYSVTTTGAVGEEVFTLNSLVGTATSSTFQKLGRNSSASGDGNAYWYSFSNSWTFTEDSHYAIVFSSTSSTAHNIYHTSVYRSDTFRQVQVSTNYTSGSGTFLNSNYTEGSSAFGEGRIGSLCVGFLGYDIDHVSDPVFDSGEVIIGGSDSKRGYPTYLFVKKAGSSVKVRFFQESPSVGDSLEANRADMTWYWYQEGTMPVTNDPAILNKTSNQARLTNTANFVLFVQPEKFAPYPKIFFPETSLTLDSDRVGAITMYDSNPSAHPIQREENIIYNTTNEFDDQNWAHFAEKKSFVFSSSAEDRDPTKCVNPSYIDAILEDRTSDVEETMKALANGTLPATGSIRGYTNPIKYKGYYMAFAKYLAGREDVTTSYSSQIATASNGDLTWSSISLQLVSSENPTGIKPLAILDAVVENVNGIETLFLLFLIEELDSEFFRIGYTQEIVVNAMDLTLVNISGDVAGDSNFVTLGVDYQLSKFLPSPNKNYLMFTTRNEANKFGLWKIDLTSTISDSNFTLVTRGFNSELDNDKEREITCAIEGNNGVFVGTSVNGNTDGRMGEVYFIDSNFNIRQIISGDITQKWFAKDPTDTNVKSYSEVFGSAHYLAKPNEKVAFMALVNNILHVWLSRENNAEGDPIHIAHNLGSNKTKVLRVFPIGMEEERTAFASNSTYEKSRTIHNITDGAICGNYIYVCGSYLFGSEVAPRCIVYDKRTINHAFESYEGASYPQIIASHKDSLDVGFSYQYGYQFGVYDGDTQATYEYFSDSKIYDDYPALLPTKTTSRVGKYCGIVFSINFTDSGVSADSETGCLEYNTGDINPRLITQNGVCYLICDNLDYGFHLYKMRGIKQDPQYWGTTTALDPEMYLPAYDSRTAYIGNGRSVQVSEIDGINFLSLYTNNATGNYPDTPDNETASYYLYMYRITLGLKKPQTLSFYYKFNYLREQYDKERYVGEIPITDQIIEDLANPGNMNLVVKYAKSWEDLYYSPTKEIVIPLAFDVSEDPENTNKGWYHYVSKSDISDTFVRIESKNLITPFDTDFMWDGMSDDITNLGYTYYDRMGDGTNTVSDPYAEILVKGLKFSDVNLLNASVTNTKKIAITGIVNNKIDPEEIINNGVNMVSGDEIIIDFPKSIFLGTVSFDAKPFGIGDGASFKFQYLPSSSQTQYGEEIVDEVDWKDIGTIYFEAGTTDYSSVENSAIREMVKTFRIVLYSEVEFSVKNLAIESFGNSTNTFTSTNVSNPELILVDDIGGLIGANEDNEASAYSTFNKEDSTMTIDLGAAYSLTRITMNTYAGLSRFIKVETEPTAAGSDWVTICDDSVIDYEYTFVTWQPKTKSQSNEIEVTVVTDTTEIGELDAYNKSLNSIETNFSTFFTDGALRDQVFKPNTDKSRNLTIVNSYDASGDNQGVLVLNAQMDEDGQFRSDVSNATGLIERKLNIDFPNTTVRRIKITTYGFDGSGEESPIKINGLKTYTALVDDDGIAETPSATPTWEITLKTSATSSI